MQSNIIKPKQISYPGSDVYYDMIYDIWPGIEEVTIISSTRILNTTRPFAIAQVL